MDYEIEIKEYEKEELEKIRKEVFKNNPVALEISAVRFVSFSKGKGKKGKKRKRKRSKVILFINLRKGSKRGWKVLVEEIHSKKGKNFLDKIATEIYGEEFCHKIEEDGIAPSEYLRDQILHLLNEFNGKF